MQKLNTIVRDISWLSFNNRVLQEAADDSVPIKERIKFMGIFSNNLDEFFRVRVATLRRMIELGNKSKVHLEINPELILESIQDVVIHQQQEFEKIWKEIIRDLKKENIVFIDDTHLTPVQKSFVVSYFNEEVRNNVVPLMIESIQDFPTLNDKSIYLACVLSKKDKSIPQRFALISIPRTLSRFVILPSKNKEKCIILLDDVIRYCLPNIFSFFGYDEFSAHAMKVTRDAEIDIDNDVATSLIQKIEKGLKNRRRGKPVRLVFDKNIPPVLLTYLVKRLGLTHKDNLIPGGKIHNFKDFMRFPSSVFEQKSQRKNPFTHPLLINKNSISSVVLERDIMLNFPYHSFNSLIDLIREAAIDPDVVSIKTTCYRLAPESKIIKALSNAVRNGKKVTVVIELRARFDEEANLEWKEKLEEAGVKVLIGVPKMKVHAKICVIKKRINKNFKHYGFISTGNLNEKTALAYGDHCLLTSNRAIMGDINRIFGYLEKPDLKVDLLKSCKTLMISPLSMRRDILGLIDKEIKNAKLKKKAEIILKLNSFSDIILINKIYDAAKAGVKVKMIIRGICCVVTDQKKFKEDIQAISIVDEYLEHSRVMVFHNNGNPKVFISSADWMVRNLDHRIEVACPILNEQIKKELIDVLEIQLKDNVKARILNNEQNNVYVNPRNTKKVRSQVEIYNFLKNIK